MKIKCIATLLCKIIIIGFLAMTTFCQFGEGDAMDSYHGSGNPLIVAVSSDTFSYVSIGGKNWAKGGSTEGLNCGTIAYGNGLFIASQKLSGPTIVISTDGAN